MGYRVIYESLLMQIFRQFLGMIINFIRGGGTQISHDFEEPLRFQESQDRGKNYTV